jgi:hypothetical protein
MGTGWEFDKGSLSVSEGSLGISARQAKRVRRARLLSHGELPGTQLLQNLIADCA